MQDVIVREQALREVERAQERFLALWAVECFWDQERALDRAVEDVQRFSSGVTSDNCGLTGGFGLDD
jgi:hypothetical protein